MSKVYVACKFRPEDSRSYTYEWSGEPLTKGDIVKVADKSGDGWKRVWVDAITEEAPKLPPGIQCKPILGIYNPDVEPDAPAKAAAGPIDLDDDEITF